MPETSRRKKNPFVTVKTNQAALKKWRKRIDLAREERKRHETTWDLLIDAYKPKVEKSGKPEDVKSNILFRVTEQKKAALFFKTPEMRLRPAEMAKVPIQTGQIDPTTGQPQQLSLEQAVTIHEQVLNHKLSEDGVNLPFLFDQLLFDCICPTGFLFSKIGYRPYIKHIEEPITEPVVDPLTGQGMVDPETGQPMERPAIDEAGKPMTQDVPVIVKEEYFWHRVSPKRGLIPADYHSTDFEMAPWLGVEFEMPLKAAIQAFNLPKDFKPKKGRDDDRLLGQNRKSAADASEEKVTGTELFYKASLEIEDVSHPDIYYQLVLIDGHRENNMAVPAVHRQSPYQEIDPNTHQLTADSMIGNPIHVGTLRDLSDSAYVPSDCAMIHTGVKEVDTYRRQNIQLRDANLTKFGYDTEKVTPKALQEIKSGSVGQYVAFVGGAFAGGIDKVIAPLAKASGSRVDTQSAFMLEQDIEKTLAMGANQQGVETDNVRTATESNIVQANSNVRMEKEQNRVLDYAIRGIRKYDALLQRFADDDEIISIVGEPTLQGLQVWNKDVIAGRFLYSIRPDSQLRLDAATERNLMMQFYNLTAQDPYNNRSESLKAIQRLFGIDPTKGMQQPPEETPEPSASFGATGADLLSAAGPVVLEMLEQGGFTFSEESKSLVQSLGIRARMMEVTGEGNPQEGTLSGPTAHGGPAERVQPIDKSQEEHTGQLTGPRTGQ